MEFAIDPASRPAPIVSDTGATTSGRATSRRGRTEEKKPPLAA